jgi:acetolactate synthase-1/2/3 large subunit
MDSSWGMSLLQFYLAACAIGKVEYNSPMNVSGWITKALIELGVQRYYCLPGGFSQVLNDSLGHSSLQPIYCLHESGAAFAACGEASYTGKLAVCLVTSGPGSTNAITGCASAWLDSLPVLFISGDTKVPLLKIRDKYNLREAGPQDVPIKHIIEKITKMSVVFTYPEIVPVLFQKAAMLALEPRRGPCWLDIPLDISSEDV